MNIKSWVDDERNALMTFRSWWEAQRSAHPREFPSDRLRREWRSAYLEWLERTEGE